MKKNIVLLPGDGIGPEIIAQATRVLETIGNKFGTSFSTRTELIGGEAIDTMNDPLPPATLEACKAANATLLGAVGGPKWDDPSASIRPEQGLLGIRKELKLFANLRPAKVYPELSSLSCLKPELVQDGLDFLVVRELTGDVYFGKPAGEEVRNGLRTGFNTMLYDEEEVRRIAKVAFTAARARKGKVCSVDKANVLDVSRLWRKVVIEEHANFADVELSHMYVDNCAMQVILNPAQFDVILTGNIFGDIISDEAAALAGSLGMLPSASLSGIGDQGATGLYEPIHGSAPDLAGQDKANPLATILSVALMLRMSLNMAEAADCVEEAVQSVLKQGYRTADIARGTEKPIGCKLMGDLVVKALEAQ